MSTKTLVNKALKEAGLAFIKLSTGGYGPYGNIEKCLKEYGKRVKGIHCSSHSPMDVTSVASDRVIANVQAVHSKMIAMLGRPDKETGRYTVSETSRSITYLSLHEERKPTYTRSANLDDGYQSTYLVPYFTTVKK